MRAAVILVLGLGTVAHAEPSHHKSTPDKFAKAAGEAFAEATAADEKGDLPTALGLYQKANAISPHPSVIYNIADVQRRLGQLPAALKSYETYLALAPNAADRREVEVAIDKLEHTPGTILLFTSPPSDPDAVTFKDAFVIVDGEIKIRPGTATQSLAPKLTNQTGYAIDVQAGRHVVELVTSLTYGTQMCTIKIGDRDPCRITAKPRIDGRVVLGSSDWSLKVLAEPKGKSLVKERFELPPGRTKLLMRDRSFECPPLVFDVARGADITYVFLTSSEYQGVERCRAFDAKKHNLHFEP